VKNLRTFILILMAVLLPVRGAVAAAMLCSGEASVIVVVEAAANDHCHPLAGHPMVAHHSASDDPAQDHASDDPSSDAHQPSCQFCAGGGCFVTPLAFPPPSVASPFVITSAAFPALIPRIPDHHPGGQDRPPRTI